MNEAISKEKYFGEKSQGGLGYEKDKLEEALFQYRTVDWPASESEIMPTRRIVFESFQKSIEALYFWCLNHWRYDQQMAIIEKITDTFAASEHSAFFGVQQQRLGLQQDKVSQFLATIGKMVKEMFQIVRELRIIDERMGYYKDSKHPDKKKRSSADITLKGIYIDLVEGGSKNPASIYGMAAQLQFTTLPDLFFSVHVSKSSEVSDAVGKLDFNRKVKEVLQRKLYTYLRWKEETELELVNRRTFTIKYLRQHFASIRLYVTWVKPYLKNVARLTTDDKKLATPDLISAFESSMVDIEILCKTRPQGNKKYYGVCIQTFEYRTKPSLSYQQEGYQRGPIHVGETKIFWRSYAWTDEDIEHYKAMRSYEDYELLGYIDGSIKAAMDALGEDLERYLKEAGERFPTGDVAKAAKKEKKEEQKKPGMFDPFLAPFKGFGELLGSFNFGKKKGEVDEEKEKAKARSAVKPLIWNHYKNFKKAHKMHAW